MSATPGTRRDGDGVHTYSVPKTFSDAQIAQLRALIREEGLSRTKLSKQLIELFHRYARPAFQRFQAIFKRQHAGDEQSRQLQSLIVQVAMAAQGDVAEETDSASRGLHGLGNSVQGRMGSVSGVLRRIHHLGSSLLHVLAPAAGRPAKNLPAAGGSYPSRKAEA